jgi:hypothetical protein
VIRTGVIAAPLIIGELVKDPDRRWRIAKATSLLGAILSEGMYAHRIQQERQRCEQRQR